MSLIKTIAEIKEVIPRLSGLSSTSVMPTIDKAGKLHLMPVLGKALYEDLDSKYNDDADAMAPLEKALMKCIKLPLAAVAMLDDMPYMHTLITDSGIRTTSTTTMTPAHRWEYMELKNAFANGFADGMELLLEFLYDHKADLPLWTDSQAFKEIDGFLIKTGRDFKKYYPLHKPHKTFWILQPVMADVEENYLSSSLGRDLLAWVKLQEEIIINADGGQLDVKKLLKKSVAHFTIKHAAEQLAIRFDQNGFTVLAAGDKDLSEDNGRAAADRSAVLLKTDAANREGQNNLSKAQNYLVRIAAGEFTEDFGADFTTAFETSPLKKDPNTLPYSNGNERRKIFRAR
jgi:hypothetical protein